jgi:hypothetical protein
MTRRFEDACYHKVKYMTRRAAKKARVMQTGQGIRQLNIYRCEYCDAYHLGHLPKRVRNGTISREKWDASR